MRDLRVALVSLNSKQKDKVYNLEQIWKWTQRARRQEAELVLFPELSITGWYTKGDIQVAEPVPGPSTGRLSEMAKALGIFISAGLLEIEGQTIYGSTQVLVGPEGFIGKARKIYIPLGDSSMYAVGQEVPIFDLHGTKVGFCICYDINFPEICLFAALQGAEVILVPRAGLSLYQRPTSKDTWSFRFGWRGILHIARACENGVYIVMVNPSGQAQDLSGNRWYYPGNGGIIAPDGDILCETKTFSTCSRMFVRTLQAKSPVDTRERDRRLEQIRGLLNRSSSSEQSSR